MGSLLVGETVAGVGDKAPAMNCLGCKRLALAGMGATGKRFVQARQGADVPVAVSQCGPVTHRHKTCSVACNRSCGL